MSDSRLPGICSPECGWCNRLTGENRRLRHGKPDLPIVRTLREMLVGVKRWSFSLSPRP